MNRCMLDVVGVDSFAGMNVRKESATVFCGLPSARSDLMPGTDVVWMRIGKLVAEHADHNLEACVPASKRASITNET